MRGRFIPAPEKRHYLSDREVEIQTRALARGLPRNAFPRVRCLLARLREAPVDVCPECPWIASTSALGGPLAFAVEPRFPLLFELTFRDLAVSIDRLDEVEARVGCERVRWPCRE